MSAGTARSARTGGRPEPTAGTEPGRARRVLDENEVEDLRGLLGARSGRRHLSMGSGVPAGAAGHRKGDVAAVEPCRAERDDGAAADVEMAVADRLLGEVERARVGRGADGSPQLRVGIQGQSQESVVAGACPLLPAVGARRCRQRFRVEGLQLVSARTVIGMVDELRALRLGVDDERLSRRRGRRCGKRVRAGGATRLVRLVAPAAGDRNHQRNGDCNSRKRREQPAVHLPSPVTWRSNRWAFLAAGAEPTWPNAPKYAFVPPVTPSVKWVPPNRTWPEASTRPLERSKYASQVARLTNS